MTTNEFNKYYLSHYMLLEHDFKATFDYVDPEKENYSAYSSIFLKQILSIGSEIDIL